MRRQIRFLMLMTCFIILGTWNMADCAGKKLLYLAGSQTSSAAYVGYVSMAKVINKALPDVNVSVVETGGSIDNMARIMKGQVDFGQVTQDILHFAYQGVQIYEKKPFKKLRCLIMYVDCPQNYMVRKDSGISKVEELDGKKFHPGMRGSTTELQCELVLSILGIKPKFYRGGSADAIEALKNADIVGQVKTGIGDQVDSASLEVHMFTPLLFLSFNEAQRKKVSEKLSYIPWVEQPKDFVKGQPSFWTNETIAGFATTADLSEDLVYRITKAVWQGIEIQRESYSALKGVDLIKQSLEKSSIPLHAGTVRYFRELGHNVPARLIPPEVK